MTKRDTLGRLADEPEENSAYRQMIKNSTITYWKAATRRSKQLQLCLESDPWKEAGEDVIKYGTDKELVDLFFLLQDNNKQLRRALMHFEKMRLFLIAKKIQADKEMATRPPTEEVTR
ncbi:hypothetical protein [Actinotignum sp. GS-2025c]